MSTELDLKPYYKYGFSLLQWMLILGTLGLVVTGIYELLK